MLSYSYVTGVFSFRFSLFKQKLVFACSFSYKFKFTFAFACTSTLYQSTKGEFF